MKMQTIKTTAIKTDAHCVEIKIIRRNIGEWADLFEVTCSVWHEDKNGDVTSVERNSFREFIIGDDFEEAKEKAEKCYKSYINLYA